VQYKRIESARSVPYPLYSGERNRRARSDCPLLALLACLYLTPAVVAVVVCVSEMSSKRKIRELALQLLFLWDAGGERSDDELTLRVTHDASDDPALRMRAVEMAAGAWEQREQIDRWLERLAPQWPPRRQPGVDRGILRLAVWELTNRDTPAKVVIDEAIELAKVYSTENSPGFVNGLLDAVLKEQRAVSGQQTRVNDETGNPNE
jgi:transcription antitermination protein NusB